MKTTATHTLIAQQRDHERGAALITVLLISTLLLLAGGALLVATSTTATTTLDSTAETQAYYAAEAGLEAALNVLRGNVAPDASLPVGTKMSFRNACTVVTSNKVGDLSGVARLSGWLQYSGLTANSTVPLVNNLAYSVQVIQDPSDPTPAPAEPQRLLITATGYGPKSARKQMQMVVSAYSFNTPGMFYMRNSESGGAMHFKVSNSASQLYTGQDLVSATMLPSISVSSNTDLNKAMAADNSKDVIKDTPQAAIVSPPWFLQTADTARAFVSQLRTKAVAMNRYFTSMPVNNSGTTAAPRFTFVDGDTDLVNGAGLLVVTGDLHIGSSDQFNGIIFVLGGGTVYSTGGNNVVYGSVYVANFDSTGGFLAPWWDTKNGGSLHYQYDSSWVILGARTLGVDAEDVVEN